MNKKLTSRTDCHRSFRAHDTSLKSPLGWAGVLLLLPCHVSPFGSVWISGQTRASFWGFSLFKSTPSLMYGSRAFGLRSLRSSQARVWLLKSPQFWGHFKLGDGTKGAEYARKVVKAILSRGERAERRTR